MCLAGNGGWRLGGRQLTPPVCPRSGHQPHRAAHPGHPQRRHLQVAPRGGQRAQPQEDVPGAGGAPRGAGLGQALAPGVQQQAPLRSGLLGTRRAQRGPPAPKHAAIDGALSGSRLTRETRTSHPDGMTGSLSAALTSSPTSSCHGGWKRSSLLRKTTERAVHEARVWENSLVAVILTVNLRQERLV